MVYKEFGGIEIADNDLEKDFLASVMDDIKILKKKYRYNPSFFLDMIIDNGIVDTAKQLIHASEPSDGYTKLWNLKALQYSIENQIQDERWHSLFSDEDREKARKRLAAFRSGQISFPIVYDYYVKAGEVIKLLIYYPNLTKLT